MLLRYFFPLAAAKEKLLMSIHNAFLRYISCERTQQQWMLPISKIKQFAFNHESDFFSSHSHTSHCFTSNTIIRWRRTFEHFAIALLSSHEFLFEIIFFKRESGVKRGVKNPRQLIPHGFQTARKKIFNEIMNVV